MGYKSYVFVSDLWWRAWLRHKFLFLPLSVSCCSCSPGLFSRGSVFAGEADYWGAVWSLHLGTHQGATLNNHMHTTYSRTHHSFNTFYFSNFLLSACFLCISYIDISTNTHTYTSTLIRMRLGLSGTATSWSGSSSCLSSSLLVDLPTAQFLNV